MQSLAGGGIGSPGDHSQHSDSDQRQGCHWYAKLQQLQSAGGGDHNRFGFRWHRLTPAGAQAEEKGSLPAQNHAQLWKDGAERWGQRQDSASCPLRQHHKCHGTREDTQCQQLQHLHHVGEQEELHQVAAEHPEEGPILAIQQQAADAGLRS